LPSKEFFLAKTSASHAMDEQQSLFPDEAESPENIGSASAFKNWLAELEKSEGENKRNRFMDREIWLRRTAAINELMQKSPDVARVVTAAEIDREKYLERIEAFEGDLRKNMLSMFRPILVAWMGSGALAQTKKGAEGIAAAMAFDKPKAWIEQLPGNLDWDLASCEAKFERDGPGAEMARALGRPEVAKPHRISDDGSAAEITEVLWRMDQGRRALARASDQAGRLGRLQAAGRGHVWLMHAIAEGAWEQIEAARAAGMSLHAASPFEARAFFWAVALDRMSPADHYSRLHDRSGRGPRGEWPFKPRPIPKAGHRASQWRRLEEADAQERAKRWALAIELGLPATDDSGPASPWTSRMGLEKRGVEAIGQRAMPILAQEAKREGRMEPNLAKLWLSEACRAPWLSGVAAAVGANRSESALEWALREKLLLSADWGAKAIAEWFREARGPQSSQALKTLADAGWRFEPLPEDKELRAPWVAQILRRAPDPAMSALALLKMGAPIEPEAGRGNWAAIMLSMGNEGFAALRAATDALEKERPGIAKRLASTTDDRGATPLHQAARDLSVESARWCVERGAQATATDPQGQTPAHWAAARHGAKNAAKLAAMVAFLQESGLSLAQMDAGGQTAMSALARRAPLEAIEGAMRSEPGTLDAKDSKGVSAIDRLAKRGGDLLAAGERTLLANLVAKNKDSNTQSDADSDATAEPARRAPRRM
jgi:hypothetical protein